MDFIAISISVSVIGIGRYGDCYIGIGIGIGRYENQKYRWLSVSAEMKNGLSVVPYLELNESPPGQPCALTTIDMKLARHGISK